MRGPTTHPGTGPSGFLRGAAYLARGLVFLARHPATWPWAAAPTILTVLAIGGAFVVTMIGLPAVAAWWPGPPDPTGWRFAWWTGVFLVALTLFGLSAVLCWFLGTLLSSPFHAVLAGLVEDRVLGNGDDGGTSMARALGDAAMSLTHSIAWLGLWLAVVVPLLAVHLLPGVGNALYAIGSFAATTTFVARELMDVPLSRRRMPFRAKLRFLRDHRAPVLGIGAITAGLLLIPLANFVVMPVAVVGASLLFFDLEAAEAGAAPVTP